MNVHHVSREEFRDLALRSPDDLLAIVDRPDAIIVKRMYEPASILALRSRAYVWGTSTEPSWHACVDGCPDYHRLHDNYPGASVKSRMHAFYWHGYHDANAALMREFGDVFAIKNSLAGMPADSFLRNVPSAGPIARVLVHHYPRGGGYQTEHIDPVSPFARIQTIVMASTFGSDYGTGGLYARPTADADPFFMDPHADIGDMIVLSPGIRHGVAAVDPEAEYDPWQNRGRWMVMPIIINSDYSGGQQKATAVEPGR